MKWALLVMYAPPGHRRLSTVRPVCHSWCSRSTDVAPRCVWPTSRPGHAVRPAEAGSSSAPRVLHLTDVELEPPAAIGVPCDAPNVEGADLGDVAFQPNGKERAGSLVGRLE